MRLALFLYFFVSFGFANSQQAKTNIKDSTSFYISRLNWHSIEYSGTYFQKLYLTDEAKIILSVKDSSKIQKLITAMDHSNKTVAIHILLTQLLEPKNQIFRERFQYGNNNLVQRVDNIYNSLVWSTSDGIHFQINKLEISRIKEYWKSKTHQKKSEL